MHDFAPFMIYVLVTTFTPGPNNILAMNYAMRYGYRNIVKFLAGIFAGMTVVMFAAGLLNISLVRLVPQVETWLKILGAVYMLYLAVHILLSRPGEKKNEKNNMNTFLGGMLLQLLNVKLILYGATVYSTFIVQWFQNPLQVSLFAPLLAGVGFVATTCWAVGGNLFRSFLERYQGLFNIAMAALLVYTAIASLF